MLYCITFAIVTVAETRRRSSPPNNHLPGSEHFIMIQRGYFMEEKITFNQETGQIYWSLETQRAGCGTFSGGHKTFRGECGKLSGGHKTFRAGCGKLLGGHKTFRGECGKLSGGHKTFRGECGTFSGGHKSSAGSAASFRGVTKPSARGAASLWKGPRDDQKVPEQNFIIRIS